MSASTTTTSTASRPCYRHTVHRWMASCDDCTAWHLGRQIAARDAAGTWTAPVLTLVPPTDRRPARVQRPAA